MKDTEDTWPSKISSVLIFDDTPMTSQYLEI